MSGETQWDNSMNSRLNSLQRSYCVACKQQRKNIKTFYSLRLKGVTDQHAGEGYNSRPSVKNNRFLNTRTDLRGEEVVVEMEGEGENDNLMHWKPWASRRRWWFLWQRGERVSG